MSLTTDQLRNGLLLNRDYLFADKPNNPDMRESTSLWLFDETKQVAFPRIGIEAEANSWSNRLFHVNVALGKDRVLVDSGRGAVPSPMDKQGKATLLGAGPLLFRCVQPFRRWVMHYQGSATDGSCEDQIASKSFTKSKANLSIEIELEMKAPAWVQDYSPETVAKMTAQEQENVQSMGIGWRLEQLCRAEGIIAIDGVATELSLVGSRIKRQGVRPLNLFRGHCWQSALFPDGNGFGTISYPATKSMPVFNIAYVYRNGIMYPARATKIPFIKQVQASGEDVSLELESELGVHSIQGLSCFSTFKVNNADMAALGAKGFTLQQAGAQYVWDGERSIGMMERSAVGLN